MGTLVQSISVEALATCGSLEDDVRSAAGGDRDAFARLIDRTRSVVCSIALAVVRDIAASEDVAQEVYLAAWQGLCRLRNSASFMPWLRQLARNRAHQHLRARAQQRIGGGDNVLTHLTDPTPSAGERLVAAQENRALMAALEKLPDEPREVVTLFYREGRSIAQVASLLDLSEAAVKKRLERARNQMREEMLDQLGEALVRSAPGAAFTLAAITALTAAAPSTAAAAGLGAGKLFKLSQTAPFAAKLVTTASGMIVGAVIFGAGLLVGIRQLKRRARDEEERSKLEQFARVNAIAATLTLAAMIFGDSLVPAWAAVVVPFTVFYALLCYFHFRWLPRIISRRQALERAEDPAAERRQRRERIYGLLGFVGGGLCGIGGVLVALWRMRHAGG